ncbi:MAG: putative inorganic carbon transporter subunit DabA [Candidatus Levyibacteriota bacterium]
MNAPLHPVDRLAHALADAVTQACDRIAPSWPLDRFIAVNPHWGWIDRPIEEAAAAVGVLAGMRLLPDVTVRRRTLIADLAGQRETVVHQISQHCAAYFDAGQARWHMPVEGDEGGLYRSWLVSLASDRGLDWPQRRRAALASIGSLPRDAMAAIGHALARLRVPEDGQVACLTTWLLDLNGWAAACAWQRWQARLAGGDDPRLTELLAIRAGWDALLADALPAATVHDWAQAWTRIDAAVAAERARQHAAWKRMESQERHAQAELIAAMSRPIPEPATTPSVQAVFCIDVRSEVLRRALEAVGSTIATRGFAGFFGLPIDYRPLGTDWRQPQLPGLLAPALTADEAPADRAAAPLLAKRRRARLAAAAAWDSWRGAPAAGFSFVEACGALYAGSLLRASLPGGDGEPDWAQSGLTRDEVCALRPRLALDPEAGAVLAQGVLRAMGLVEGIAPLVLLCGHAGQSANNPHAAGLDCGACGGRSGEVNARALAALLNDADVRAALAARGLAIPRGTWFVAGVHNTTTDDVQLFDTDLLPPSHGAALEALHGALAKAGRAARAERAPGLGLPKLPAPVLHARLRERATHWAETRPEWALVDNAAFIAAPRSRTQGANLGGRVFLHDYDHRLDVDRSVLKLILTAPVVVAHWINLQYLASSVDPQRQGAGNKLLHNVVGGGVGVFEGNRGDLRIGLPWQSVHDGARLRHTPRRLSVFVEAPREAIDAVIASHVTVRHLVDHGWLHLLAMEGGGVPVFHRRCRGGGWELVR